MKQSLIENKAVEKITGLSRSSIYRLEKSGKFPKRITQSSRSVRWALLEVSDWVNDRLEGRV
jgi:prophage regulatory protein